MRPPGGNGQPYGEGPSREDGFRRTARVTTGLVGVSAAAVLGFGILAHGHSSATTSTATSSGTGTATSSGTGTSQSSGTSTSQSSGSTSSGSGLVSSGGSGGSTHGQTSGS
ncbi:hypothetical protein I6A60_28495 [Frankia sp. AgB1.9]|nr:hypothetical protein [Frankia sp. AgW1.1]MBL7551771.1 hypothetical protein [Frankia sp. AgB1.9]MBL7621092.1 hypothetical protein [Frankia sp. AgB1.8]